MAPIMELCDPISFDLELFWQAQKDLSIVLKYYSVP